MRLAESWTQQKTYDNLTEISQKMVIGEDLVAGSVDSISFDFNITEALLVEHVQFKMDFPWRATGDLDVYLTSAEGTTVRLVHDLPHSSSVGNLRFFEFSSVATMGELATGTWTVTIVNNNPEASNKDGSAQSAKIDDVTFTVLGSTINLADDTYIYTDEFGSALYSGDDLAARQILRDEDGGNDTINAAAVTSNSVIDLSGANATIIAGLSVNIGAGMIENAFTGDGDDTIVGSDAANILTGGRGDDTIYWSGGADLIDGQQGNDTLVLSDAFTSFSGYISNVGEIALSLVTGVITAVQNVETLCVFRYCLQLRSDL